MKDCFLQARPILEALTEAGYEAVFVGGCVRDTLLKRTVQDVDIATSATPEEIKQIFTHTIDVGIRFGTVIVLLEGHSYEVTTFRSESDYADFRRPKQVQFVANLESDLQRRDFTMNAIAMDQEGRIIDYHKGQEALAQYRIEAVGNPDERFQEDALRMLRAIRFQSQLGFYIEKETWSAITRNTDLIYYISQERITVEFEKILTGEAVQLAIANLVDTGLILQLEGLSPQIGRIDFIQVDTLEERWVQICLALNVSAKTLLRKWKYPKIKIQYIAKLQQCVQEVEKRGWNNKRLYFYGLDIAQSAEKILGIDRNVVVRYAKLKIKSADELAITGSDLLEWFKKEPGSWISELLHTTIDAILKGEVENKKSAIRRWLLQN